MRRKSIEGILLETGLVTSSQIRRAKKIKKNADCSLLTAIITLDIASEQDLLTALSQTFNIDYITTEKLFSYEVSKETLELIPKKTQMELNILPLKFDSVSFTLEVATSYPIGKAVMETLTKSTSKKIKPVLALSESISREISKRNPVLWEKEIKHEDDFPAFMRREICSLLESEGPPLETAAPPSKAKAEDQQKPTIYYLNVWFKGDKSASRTGIIYLTIKYDLAIKIDKRLFEDILASTGISEEKLMRDIKDNVELCFSVHAPGFRREFFRKDKVIFRRDKGTEEIVFNIEPSETGLCELEVMVERGGDVIASLSIPIRVMSLGTEETDVGELNERKPATEAEINSSHLSYSNTIPCIRLEILCEDKDNYKAYCSTDTADYYAGPINLPFNFERRLKSYVKWYDDLNTISRSYAGTESAPYATPEENEDFLKKCAEVGREIHNFLFGDWTLQNKPLESLKEFIKSPGSPGGYTILLIRNLLNNRLLSEFYLPWNLVYDGPDPSSEPVDPAGFWGYRFIIQHLPRSVRMNGSPELDLSGTVQPCINPFIEKGCSNRQSVYFQNICNAAPCIQSHSEFENYIKSRTGSHDILYFYCHAKNAHNWNEFYQRNELPDDAWLKLEDQGELKVKGMRTWLNEFEHMTSRPLIFLNACETGQSDLVFNNPILELFTIYWGARGYIGADWKLPGIFADRFAKDFFNDFLGTEKPLGIALFELRKKIIDTYKNPFPLLYSQYASHRLRAGEDKYL